VGDAADHLTETMLDQKALHDAGLCNDPGCEWCKEEEIGEWNGIPDDDAERVRNTPSKIAYATLKEEEEEEQCRE
jgi:hypothetical protein